MTQIKLGIGPSFSSDNDQPAAPFLKRLGVKENNKCKRQQKIQQYVAVTKRKLFELIRVYSNAKNLFPITSFLISHITDLGEKILGITVNPDQFEKRTDCPDDPIEYKAYVKGHIQASMLVRCCETFSYTQSGYPNGTTFIAKVGDFGRTISPQFSTVQVKWENRITCSPKDCFVNLELLTGPLHTTLLSSS